MTTPPALPYLSLNRVGGFFDEAAQSDHRPYWDAGLIGVMLTDIAFKQNLDFLTSDLHSHVAFK